MIQTWSSVTLDALQSLWHGFVSFVPNLIGAGIVIIIGWLISVWIGKLVALILRKAKFDAVFEKNKWQEAMEKADLKMEMSDFIGAIVKWVLAIVFLLS